MHENRLSCTDYMQPGFQSRTAVFAPTKLVNPRGCGQVLRYGMQGLHPQHLSHSVLQSGSPEHAKEESDRMGEPICPAPIRRFGTTLLSRLTRLIVRLAT